MSVRRPPTKTLSPAAVLIMRSFFFRNPSGCLDSERRLAIASFFLDALDFLSIWVVIQSLKREELWWMQLEWLGNYFSDDRVASYSQGSQPATCSFWKLKISASSPWGSRLYFMSFLSGLKPLFISFRGRSVECPCGFRLHWMNQILLDSALSRSHEFGDHRLIQASPYSVVLCMTLRLS